MKGLRAKLKSVKNNLNLLLILVFCLMATSLYAESASKMTISAGPSLNYQHIFYDSDNYQNRKTLGPGFSFSFDYALSHPVALGTNVTYEYESYKNFYSYHDLKVSLNAIVHLSKKDRADRVVNFYALMGSGVDFVFRNDGDFGLYFLIRSGLAADFRLSTKVNLYVKPLVEMTFQKGSSVLHASLGIGATVKLVSDN